ncbi:TIGR00730 family Rossman fold protein [Chlamydiota bacterium]
MKNSKEYKTGIESIDEKIGQLAKNISSHNTDLLTQMLTTISKAGLELKDRGDLKLINTALKELRYASKVFSPFRNMRKAVIFGSARIKPDDHSYRMAEELAELLVKNDFKVITGGGPGIMEAGNKGAGREDSFSLNIRLPFEQGHNPYIIGDKKAMTFKYFFNRKLFFLKESDATILFPGGFGTLDEGFENLTLIQTGKSKPRPIILIEPPHSQYWGHWLDLVMGVLAGKGYISRDDLHLFIHTDKVNEAIEHIQNFYKVYHSIRYVKDKTVLRLTQKLSSENIDLLNKKFKKILKKGSIIQGNPLPEEMRNNEFPELPRLVLNFDRHHYGKLCEMINIINAMG